MNKHPLQSICEDLADDLGLEVRSYSGRGMFGAHCFGVVVSNLGPLLAGIARTIADMDPNDDATGHTVDQIAEALHQEVGVHKLPIEGERRQPVLTSPPLAVG